MNRLREAWQSIIKGEDYDAHMAAVGQAQANASLVEELFTKRPPQSGAAVLFAGAGTGQIFDYLDPQRLAPFEVMFTDINAAYLERLQERLASVPTLRFSAQVDDIENTALTPGFGLAVAVLLLEHVDAKKAIEALCRLARRVFVVIQENPPEAASAMTRTRPTFGSMQVFQELDSHLISHGDVEAEFQRQNFTSVGNAEREVLDQKKMLGLEFRKASDE
jgi:hypothetical protein